MIFFLRLKLGCITEKLQLHSHSHHAYKPKQKESLNFDVAKASIFCDDNDNKKIFFHISCICIMRQLLQNQNMSSHKALQMRFQKYH